MEIFFLWIPVSFAVAFLGIDRKIGYWGTFILSILLSPLVGIIIALTSKRKREYLSHVQSELTKLKDMKEKGLLTEDEFKQQKAKLFE